MKQLKEGMEIHASKSGRLFLLLSRELDKRNKKFTQSLCLCGSPVSSSILMAATRGIIIH